MAERARAVPGLRAATRPTCCASSATTAAPPTATQDGYEKLTIAPVPLDARRLPRRRAWSRPPSAPGTSAIALGEEHGFRNAQATVIAPTGTIGLVMDCDTTGIEPDFALVKFKKLAGGGYFKIINQAGARALRTLGYARERDRGHRGLRGRPRHAGAGARASTTRR